jgi:hypothetical protein
MSTLDFPNSPSLNDEYVFNGKTYIWNGVNWSNVSSGFTGSFGFTGSRGFTGSIGFTGSVGFAGSQGVIGFTGSQGVIGFTGSQGIQGVIGFTGSVGFTGSQGVIGFTGSQGIQGVIGFTGSAGFTGSQGIQGVIGFTGSQGIQGVIGFTGSVGFTGSQGIQGVTGFTGSLGFTGSQGAGFTGSKGDIGFTGSAGSGGLSGTVNRVAKFDTTTTLTDSQIFDDGTNVGIGTTTPASKLSVAGNITLDGNILFSPLSTSAIISRTTTEESIRVFGGTSATDGAGISFFGSTSPTQAGNMFFNAGGALNIGATIFRNHNGTAFVENMRINSAGNVGIGTASPAQSLDVVGLVLSRNVLGTITTTAISKTLAVGEFCTVTAAGLTITLPASPAAGWKVAIGVLNFTDTIINRNSQNIMGLAENMTIDKTNVTVTLQFVDATRGWKII